MSRYLVTYSWFENANVGIIEAEDESSAIIKFAMLTHKLESNYLLEREYGYVSGLSPFFYDSLHTFVEGRDKTLEETLTQFVKTYKRNFQVVELTSNSVGILTSEGLLYNGQDVTKQQ